jgi:hypothetical protein
LAICQWFDLKTVGTVCQWFGLKTIGTVFSGLASKPVATVFSGLASKLVVTVFSDLTSKPVATVSPVLASKLLAWVYRFGHQNRQLRFGDFCLKIITTVSSFGPQNQSCYGFLVVPQNRWEGDGVGHALRSNGLLHVKISRARVFLSALKIAGGETVGGAHCTIAKVVSRSS